MNIFSVRLKQQRKLAGVTQKEMAATLNMAERNYQRYESGENEPTFDGLVFLCKFFNVSADYLLGITDKSNKQSNKLFDCENSES